MAMTQLQIRGHELEKQLRDLQNKLAQGQPGETSGHRLRLSPAMVVEFEQVKSEFAGKSTDLRNNATAMEKIRDELARLVCGKVGK
jgi:hypothetical protein